MSCILCFVRFIMIMKLYDYMRINMSRLETCFEWVCLCVLVG